MNDTFQSAYIILAHKNPVQLALLIEALQHEDHFFFIHIDSKSNQKSFEQEIDSRKLLNCSFVYPRENGNWGDLGIVKATLNCLSKALSASLKIDFIHLLSGQDFPVKPIPEIREFFRDHSGQCFMEYTKFPVHHLSFGGMERIKHYSYNIRGKRHTYLPFKHTKDLNFKGYIMNAFLGLLHLFSKTRKIPNDLVPYYGSQWWSLSSDAALYILEYVTKNPHYIDFHKRTLLPDELFFQTILVNSHFKNQLVNDNLRYIRWDKDKGSHPKTLSTIDLESIKASGKLFARKFNENDPILKLLL